MKPETNFDLSKIQAAIEAYNEAYASFDEAYTELKEYTESEKEELRHQREQNHKRIHELELMLAGSPSQMLRDVEAKIKLHRKKLNANWAVYNPGRQRAIDEFEAEREKLIEETRRTPTTLEETELGKLREIKYAFSPDAKEKITLLFDKAQKAYNTLRAARDSVTAEIKVTTKAMEQCRFDVVNASLVNMGQRYIDSIKIETTALCEGV